MATPGQKPNEKPNMARQKLNKKYWPKKKSGLGSPSKQPSLSPPLSIGEVDKQEDI